MRIQLIRPNSVIRPVPMPLGLGYLSTALKNERHEVSLLDARLARLSEDEVMKRVKAYQPDVTGLSVLHFDAPDAHRLASRIKKELPDTRVVMGGPYASATGEAALEDRNVDVLVFGEGEQTLPRLVESFVLRRPLDQVKGIAFRPNGCTRRTEPREPISDLDALKVDWDALHPPKYFSAWQRTAMNSIQHSSRVAPIFTSRGCPFACIYCHSIFGRRFRARSPVNVVDEIEKVKQDWGIKEFEVSDDAFNLNMDRAKEIAKTIIERRLGIRLAFPNGVRADLIDDELLDLLKAAGTFRINFAVESASPRIQKLIGKAMNLDKARESIAKTAARGIVAAGFFILGFPNENMEEMGMTVDFAVKSDLHVASFFYLCPFPGTPLAESYPSLTQQIRKMRFADYTQISMNLSAVSNEELTRVCKKAYRLFYFRIKRMRKVLSVVPKNLRMLTSVFDIFRLSLKNSVNY